MSKQIVKANGGAIYAPPDEVSVMKLVTDGDCSKLGPLELTAYYNYRCQSIGLDPACTPFQLIRLNGKLVMYATKACTDQLTSNRKLNVEITDQRTEAGVRMVKAKITEPGGRSTEDIGCVAVQNLTGDALCNALMKAVTKAKRRAVLSFCGLGMLDESEIETIPGAVRATYGKAATLSERLGAPGPTPEASAGPRIAPQAPVDPEQAMRDAEALAAKVIAQRGGHKIPLTMSGGATYDSTGGGVRPDASGGASAPGSVVSLERLARGAVNMDSEPDQVELAQALVAAAAEPGPEHQKVSPREFGADSPFQKMLVRFATAKAAIGPDAYYAILRRHGLPDSFDGKPHANKFKTVRDGEAALADMTAERKRQKGAK